MAGVLHGGMGDFLSNLSTTSQILWFHIIPSNSGIVQKFETKTYVFVISELTKKSLCHIQLAKGDSPIQDVLLLKATCVQRVSR